MRVPAPPYGAAVFCAITVVNCSIAPSLSHNTSISCAMPSRACTSDIAGEAISSRARGVQERSIRLQRRLMISNVAGLHIGQSKVEDRIVRVAGSQSFDESQRRRVLPLVPR